MRRVLVVVAVLVGAPVGWAAETDVENPAYRDLPLRGSVSGGAVQGGRRHQPTPSEIDQRAQERGRSAEEQKRASDDLYQRVLKQSQQGTPRSLAPSQ